MLNDVLYKIEAEDGILMEQDWSLDDDFILESNKYTDFREEIQALKNKGKILKQYSIDDLLNFFDSFATYWIESEQDFLKRYIHHGFSFLIDFCKRENLESLVKKSLKGNIYYLDDFIYSDSLKKKIMCSPRGVITHWLAGNVPILGIISVIQGIVTKNVNVLKLSRDNGLVVPMFINKMKEHNIKTRSGGILLGADIAKTILFTYCDHDSKTAQQKLSFNSNVRVAWGGLEAVKSVLALPKRPETQDLIFGPKYSLAVIGKESLTKNNIEDLVMKISIDASVFDQQGCNAPHTIFVERGGEVNPEDFTKKLAMAMDNVWKTLIPKPKVSPSKQENVFSIREEYNSKGTVYKSDGLEWTVIYSEEKGLGKPCFSRVVSVRPVDDIFETTEYISERNQTLGLSLDEDRKLRYAKLATENGIDRITPIGKMYHYNYPWDGIFPMSRFVRWTSLE